MKDLVLEDSEFIEDVVGQASARDTEQRLRLALARAEGVLEYADLDKKVIKQLRELDVAATAYLECSR